MGRKKSVSRLTAKDVMTTDVLCVHPDWPVEQLADFLVENAISGAPVTNAGGELVGVVSLTDIARSDSQSTDPRAVTRHEYYLQVLETDFGGEDPGSFLFEEPHVKIREIMTPVVIDVQEDAPIRDVADRMIRNRVHRLFVTREGKVVGIISALDMLQVIRDR
jgi:CBS domain-containing protein